MLNLSDKELDRLSREAAQEYDPGDVLEKASWEKLEISMDRDLGRLPANPLRHIRRFPFYYAPALLVLIGVSYFLVRQGTKGSGSPPVSGKLTETAAVKNISSSKTPEYSDKLNSTPAASSVALPPAAAGKSASAIAPSNTDAGSPSPASSLRDAHIPSPASPLRDAHTSGPTNSPSPASSKSDAHTASDAGSLRDAHSVRPTGSSSATTKNSAGLKSGNPTVSYPGNQTNPQTHTQNQGRNHNGTRNRSAGITGSSVAGAIPGTAPSNIIPGNSTSGIIPGTTNPGTTSGNSASGNPGKAIPGTTNPGTTTSGTSTPGANPGASPANPSSGPAANNTRNPNRELTRSTPGGLSRTKNPAYIDDSALRHFNIKTGMPQITYKALHINRALEFGVLAAPDFASVNALAGDKAGSTIGITVDYQFANRWYLGTGLLLDRKNYAARAQDFATPPPNIPLTQNVISHMQYVKGSFEMLELPLNLRYDFSVAGSTLFFASGGVSSYLFTSENNGIYYFDYGRLSCDPQKSPKATSYLFSSLHFSLGVETGLSNSLSLLIAPYAELPMRGVGMGQVQMSSVGIDFSLKFAPVTSRKRY